MIKQSKLLSIFLAAATACLVLSTSIAAPILCRPFYYAHIDAYALDDYTGLTTQEIRQAYDEMLDFCVGLEDEFSVGVLRWSESGKSHFEDVRKLFILDLAVMAVSAVSKGKPKATRFRSSSSRLDRSRSMVSASYPRSFSIRQNSRYSAQVEGVASMPSSSKLSRL